MRLGDAVLIIEIPLPVAVEGAELSGRTGYVTENLAIVDRATDRETLVRRADRNRRTRRCEGRGDVRREEGVVILIGRGGDSRDVDGISLVSIVVELAVNLDVVGDVESHAAESRFTLLAWQERVVTDVILQRVFIVAADHVEIGRGAGSAVSELTGCRATRGRVDRTEIG